METKLTFDLLPIIGIVVALLAWYIPGFKNWYEALVPEKKQLFMVGLLFVVTLVVAGLSAVGFLSVYVGPTWKEWIWYPLVDFVIAIIANAGIYKATNYLLGNGK